MIKKDPQFVVSRISLKKPSIVEIKEELPTNFDRQLEIFFDAKTAYPSFILDAKILDRQITLLNLLEEFSLKVLARGTTSSPVLKALHNVFVETVEQNSVALLFVRDLKNTPPTYESILSLYRAWVDGTTKTVLIKNLYSAGLINKEQKDYFYTVRREEKGF